MRIYFPLEIQLHYCSALNKKNPAQQLNFYQDEEELTVLRSVEDNETRLNIMKASQVQPFALIRDLKVLIENTPPKYIPQVLAKIEEKNTQELTLAADMLTMCRVPLQRDFPFALLALNLSGGDIMQQEHRIIQIETLAQLPPKALKLMSSMEMLDISNLVIQISELPSFDMNSDVMKAALTLMEKVKTPRVKLSILQALIAQPPDRLDQAVEDVEFILGHLAEESCSFALGLLRQIPVDEVTEEVLIGIVDLCRGDENPWEERKSTIFRRLPYPQLSKLMKLVPKMPRENGVGEIVNKLGLLAATFPPEKWDDEEAIKFSSVFSSEFVRAIHMVEFDKRAAIIEQVIKINHGFLLSEWGGEMFKFVSLTDEERSRVTNSEHPKATLASLPAPVINRHLSGVNFFLKQIPPEMQSDKVKAGLTKLANVPNIFEEILNLNIFSGDSADFNPKILALALENFADLQNFPPRYFPVLYGLIVDKGLTEEQAKKVSDYIENNDERPYNSLIMIMPEIKKRHLDNLFDPTKNFNEEMDRILGPTP